MFLISRQYKWKTRFFFLISLWSNYHISHQNYIMSQHFQVWVNHVQRGLEMKIETGARYKIDKVCKTRRPETLKGQISWSFLHLSTCCTCIVIYLPDVPRAFRLSGRQVSRRQCGRSTLHQFTHSAWKTCTQRTIMCPASALPGKNLWKGHAGRKRSFKFE